MAAKHDVRWLAVFLTASLICSGNDLAQAAQKSPSRTGKSSPSKTAPARRAPAKKSSGKKGTGKNKTVLSDSGVPMTGIGPATPVLDEAILRFIEKSRCTGATLAVSKGDEIIYARGYGWLDAEKSAPTPPDAMFRVASISKPITAAAIRQLIRDGKLSLDDKVWDVLQLKPPAGVNVDPRWREITIGQLLEHKGGWDIKGLGFDPMFQAKRVAKELGLNHPAGPDDVVRWMLDKPLQFDPGKRDAYSNFGYCLLGRVIEKVTKRPYLTYLRQNIFKPVGIDPKEVQIAFADEAKRNKREPWYNEPLAVDVMDAHGGVVISSLTLCEYMDHYWISGEPRKVGEKGYVYTFFGSMPGTAAIAHQRADGINFAAEFNGRHGDANQDKLTAELNKIIDGLK